MKRLGLGAAAAWFAVFAIEFAIHAARLVPAADLVLFLTPVAILVPLFWAGRLTPSRFEVVAILASGAYVIAFVELNAQFLQEFRTALLNHDPGSARQFGQVYRMVDYPLLLLGAPFTMIAGLRRRR